MAVNPHDVPITREMVWGWLQEYDGQIRDTKKLREYLVEHLIESEIADPSMVVSTVGNDSLADETSVVDLILLDIESYADARSS